ncbi:MAG: amidophosphoribosyltransferase, partial [Limnobacter sp.]|nr:amidophosphoribosyltransferase [Limnobacter sp.]
MCGVVGVFGHAPVNQVLYDSLLLLQHRGQDAAGISTANGNAFCMFKGNGLVRDVFRTRNMRQLLGTSGVGHVRYPTAGSAASQDEAQPFYVNAPYGMMLAHNGNLTNSDRLKAELFKNDRRHINTTSDSEVLLNVLAHELQQHNSGYSLEPATIFRAVAGLHERTRGAYACVAQIAGYGLLAFRDPYGIRPLVIGETETENGKEYMFASESVALAGCGFKFIRDVEPGEAVFVDLDGQLYAQQCAQKFSLNPCIFEYVYLARPDSIMDGVPVYEARVK